VDGHKGLLIIDPDDETLARYEEKRASDENRADRYQALKDKPSVTHDGTPVALLGNIELAQEAAHCLDYGAEGVGLYRTEFLYLDKTADPTEEEHYEAYRAVLQTLGPNRPLVIRTLDLGADKFANAFGGILGTERNPFLGLRSIRLCLKQLDLFKTQIRAILRAAVHGDVRMMFPMISTVEELRHCKTLLVDVKEDLEDEGIPYKPDLPVGTMIEVPSAALLSDVLAKEVDFFSIGTNDLVQYTLAADRNNENVADLYNPADPAVLRLMERVVEAGRNQRITVNVCGEMSGGPLYVPLLVGLGLRQLSATPRKIPEIKRVIRQLKVAEAEQVAKQVMRMDTARQVTNYLRDQLRRILPEAAD
jgi:phosphotransferase system enzyme I (PtsI)